MLTLTSSLHIACCEEPLFLCAMNAPTCGCTSNPRIELQIEKCDCPTCTHERQSLRPPRIRLMSASQTVKHALLELRNAIYDANASYPPYIWEWATHYEHNVFAVHDKLKQLGRESILTKQATLARTCKRARYSASGEQRIDHYTKSIEDLVRQQNASRRSNTSLDNSLHAYGVPRIDSSNWLHVTHPQALSHYHKWYCDQHAQQHPRDARLVVWLSDYLLANALRRYGGVARSIARGWIQVVYSR